MAGGCEVELKNVLGAVPDRTRALLGQVVRKTAFDVEAQAKVNAPVDTGALRNSIQAESTGELEAEVGVGVEYAVYVEMGTVRTPAQPYLGPAVEGVRPAFEAALLQAVAEGLEG